MSKIYGYCRISKNTQNIQRQIDNIEKVYENVLIVEEVFTGTKIEGREKWNKLFKRVKKGDKIVFDSVSRMSRNSDEGVSQYMELFDRGVELEFLKEPHINTATYRKQLEGVNLPSTENAVVNAVLEGVEKALKELAKEQIKIAFNQAEKEVMDIRQRTKEGIRNARKEAELKEEKKRIGRQVGEKVTTKKSIQVKEQIKKLSKDFLGSNTDVEVMAITKVARNTYYKYKRELVVELQEEQNKSK